MTPSSPPESLDIDKLRQWIGREQEAHDVVTPRLIEQWHACFDDPAGTRQESETGGFPGLHWALALDATPLASMDGDGHMARGLFLPPVPLRDRLWAGGRLEHLDPLRVGDEVWRRSRIEDIAVKQGRSGILCFIKVRHEFTTQRGPAVIERQDIVYKDHAAEGAAGQTRTGARTAVPTASWTLNAGPLQLFRYSALTFNGHLIHYDRDFCRAQGYPGLLVHGPLQATLLLRLASSMQSGALPRVFDYRAQRPLFEGVQFSVNAAPGDPGLDLWTADSEGATMLAQARW